MAELTEYPYTPQTLKLGNYALSYLDEGQGFPVVMVHGNPSWSYLYRQVVSTLHAGYRCIVPDHMGCGFSDKPQDYPYTVEQHSANLEALLDHLEIRRCVLMVHDWGGAIGMGWAGRYPDRVAGLVVMNTAAFRSARMPFRIAVCRWPWLGKWLVRGLNGFAGAAVYMAVHKKMKKDIAAGFLAPYQNWADRVAIHAFVKDIPMTASHPSWQTLVQIEEKLPLLKEKPMLLCWGGRDFCFTKAFYEEWLQRFPDAIAHFYPDAGHYLLEDAGPEIIARIKDFLALIMKKEDAGNK